MRRFILILLAGLAAWDVSAVAVPSAPGAPAATPAAVPAPVYAVLSLIGDKLDVVHGVRQTGTRVDANHHQWIDITTAVFDDAAVSAAAQAIRRADPRAELAVLNTRSPVLFAQQRTLFAESDGVVAVPDAIRDALRQQQATRLVLITKHRADAAFRFANLIDSSGKLEGLGFFVDTETPTRQMERSGIGIGFIAPFVYIEVAIVDVATAQLLKRQRITAAYAYSAARAPGESARAWSALTSAEKVSVLNALIREEVARVIGELL